VCVCLSLCDDIFSQQQDETTSHSSQVHHQETKNERSGDRDGDVVKDEENFLSKNGKNWMFFFFLSREIAGVPYSHKKSIIYLSVGRGVSRATTRNAPLSLFSSYFQPRHGSLYPLPSSLHLRFV